MVTLQEGDITLTVDRSLMVTYEQLAEIRSKGDKQILDTRPQENYTGKEEEPSTCNYIHLARVDIHQKTGKLNHIKKKKTL